MGKKRYVPRWIHSRIALTALNGELVVDPELFMNKTSWPMKIEHLTIFGYPLDATGPFHRWFGVGPMVQAEIGMSGATDINLVPAYASAAFMRKEPFVQIGDIVQGTFFKFKHPYLLPRDGGITAEVHLNSDDTGALTFDMTIKYGIVFHGVKVQTGQPVMIAGIDRRIGAPPPSGSTIVFDSADLMNDGEEDVLIHSMHLVHPMDDFNNILMGTYWKINPSSGLPWMDAPVHISGITPYVQGLQTQRGILSYSLTPVDDAYLLRRQRFGIKLSPLTGEDQPLNITLFGYLEVE